MYDVDDEGVFIIEARKCRRCGRLLTSKEAIKKGVGCQCELKEAREARENEPIFGQSDIFDFINRGSFKKGGWE